MHGHVAVTMLLHAFAPPLQQHVPAHKSCMAQQACTPAHACAAQSSGNRTLSANSNVAPPSVSLGTKARLKSNQQRHCSHQYPGAAAYACRCSRLGGLLGMAAAVGRRPALGVGRSGCAERRSGAVLRLQRPGWWQPTPQSQGAVTRLEPGVAQSPRSGTCMVWVLRWSGEGVILKVMSSVRELVVNLQASGVHCASCLKAVCCRTHAVPLVLVWHAWCTSCPAVASRHKNCRPAGTRLLTVPAVLR